MITIKADMHTHTLASDHAYCTPLEMISYAKEAGLELITITDHAPGLGDAPHIWHFHNLRNIPRVVYGVKVLGGIEANIMDKDGSLDVDEDTFRKLDFAIASYHHLFPPGSVAENTRAYLTVLENPYIDLLGHSGTPDFAYAYDTVIRRAGELGKCIEINEHSFVVRKGNIENCKAIAQKCMEYGVNIMVNSDAHFCFDMGHYENALSMLAEIGFPEELIVNQTADRLVTYLNQRPGRKKIEFQEEK